MTLSFYAARATLCSLLQQHPDWSTAQLALALGYSQAWVKKWRKRLRDEQAAGVPLEQILHGHGCARKTAPAKTDPLVVQTILSLRDQPPEGLRRVPGPKAIQYFLARDRFVQFFGLPIPSRKTIYRVLIAHQRIASRQKPAHQPLPRPAPMSAWQMDFKDVSSVPAAPDGKRQHVVETLNIIDTGTSILLDAHVRADFTAETALEALAQTLAKYGCPTSITLDRDPRWVGSPSGSDFPAALLRFGACLGIKFSVCDPQQPQQNAFVERYHRTYQEECLALDRPADLAAAQAVTEAFVRHYNLDRPHQGLAAANRPPLVAFAPLPALAPLPATVDPDGWLGQVDGLQVERKVDQHGMVSLDRQRYSVSTRLTGQRVVLQLDAPARCIHVRHEQRIIKTLPVRGLLGHALSFEQFLTHMLSQTRAQARLRSLQERRSRMAARATP